MLWSRLMILLFVVKSESDCPNVKTALSGIRKRRHLTFPDNTNFVMTISLVKAFMTHAPSGWNISLEIDVLFPMPNANFTNAYYRRKLHHRQKRQFWEKLQNAIEYQNLNGQACILRSICEAKTHLAPPGKSLVHDLLRVIFTLVFYGVSTDIVQLDSCSAMRLSDTFVHSCGAPLHEKEFAEEVRGVYDELLEPDVCDKVNECPFSLLHFVFVLNKQKY